MTEIEQKALELVNEVRKGNCWQPNLTLSRNDCSRTEALCRAIEQHEAFRQAVSDAVEEYFDCEQNGSRSMLEVAETRLQRFIIAKPDPLVEAVKDILDDDSLHNAEEFSEAIRASLAKRGLEIREKD